MTFFSHLTGTVVGPECIIKFSYLIWVSQMSLPNMLIINSNKNTTLIKQGHKFVYSAWSEDIQVIPTHSKMFMGHFSKGSRVVLVKEVLRRLINSRKDKGQIQIIKQFSSSNRTCLFLENTGETLQLQLFVVLIKSLIMDLFFHTKVWMMHKVLILLYHLIFFNY